MIRTILVLCIAIVALDALESAIARSTGVPYAWFMLVQIVVYVAIGFALRRRGLTMRRVAIAAAVTAVVEATAGEAVAIVIGGAPPTPVSVQLVVLPLVVIVETLLALTGFALGSIGRTARP